MPVGTMKEMKQGTARESRLWQRSRTTMRTHLHGGRLWGLRILTELMRRHFRVLSSPGGTGSLSYRPSRLINYLALISSFSLSPKLTPIFAALDFSRLPLLYFVPIFLITSQAGMSERLQRPKFRYTQPTWPIMLILATPYYVRIY